MSELVYMCHQCTNRQLRCQLAKPRSCGTCLEFSRTYSGLNQLAKIGRWCSCFGCPCYNWPGQRQCHHYSFSLSSCQTRPCWVGLPCLRSLHYPKTIDCWAEFTGGFRFGWHKRPSKCRPLSWWLRRCKSRLSCLSLRLDWVSTWSWFQPYTRLNSHPQKHSFHHHIIMGMSKCCPRIWMTRCTVLWRCPRKKGWTYCISDKSSGCRTEGSWKCCIRSIASQMHSGNNCLTDCKWGMLCN